MQEITNIEHLYRVSRWAYSIGSPILSDAEYDILQRSFRGPVVAETEDTYSMEDCPVELLQLYGMTDLIRKVVLSGEKSQSIISINSIDEAREYYTARSGRKYHLSYKMNGWNMQAHYLDGFLVEVQSRGRKSDALDCSILKPIMPQEIPIKGHIRVYGEVTLTESNFKLLKKRFPSRNYEFPRAAVSGALSSAPELLTFHAFFFDEEYYDIFDKFQVLMSWGFNVPPNTFCFAEEVVEKTKQLSEDRDWTLESDGIVAYGMGQGMVRDVRALRIYSWENQIYQSTIIGYNESYGRHYIGLKLAIEPLRTASGMQYEVDIDNTDRIQTNKLYVGSPVVFEKVSDAIANISLPLTRLAQEGKLLLDGRSI